MTKQNNTNTKTTNKTSSKTVGEVWVLEELLAGKTFDEWLNIIKPKVEKFKQYRTQLNDKITPQKILEIIKLEEEISTAATRVDAYYALKCSENTQDSEALAKMTQLSNIGADINNDTMFFGLWFMELKDDIAKKLLDTKELKPYKYHLESLRKLKPYTKSEEIEQIITVKNVTGGNAHSNVYDIITNKYTFKWLGKTIGKEEVVKFVREKDPKNREKAYNLVLGREYGSSRNIQKHCN